MFFSSSTTSTLPRDVTARCDVARVVDATARIVRADVGQVVRIQVVAADSPVAAIDKSALGQVVMNLLLNAVQAVSERPDDGTPAEVEVRVTREDGEAVVRVRDHGPGVPPGQEERIFDPYFTTRAAGNGLGLAVVKGLVQRVGGSIRVTRPEGGGACFEVRLPAAPANDA
jgi:signal transduction histidine kinase